MPRTLGSCAQADARTTRLGGFDVSFLPQQKRVRHMRRITAAYLVHWGLPELVDNVQLIVSELVTNAIDHGNGPVRLKVACRGGEVRVEVRDGNAVPATLREADEDDESGRGLGIVAYLASDWGVSPDGTTTWCSFLLPTASP
ncbi:ATP-binding protein [Streptomyces sp. SBC-4]|nr:ATP-binding protein [Streptomyces sp. SBC-4]MDV5145474.1 ATP-binding protein [Streptomyces sp. SBC-4]